MSDKSVTINQAVNDFLLAKKADRAAEKTIVWYKSILAAFVESVPDVNIASVTTKDMRLYVVGIQERDERYVDGIQRPPQEGGVSEATLSAHVRALKAFWNWCHVEYQLSGSPMKGIRPPGKRTTMPKSIDPKDFVKLFNACSDDAMGDRDRAILTFLADTGCRLQGVLTLTTERLYLSERRAFVHEKGRKSRYVHFTHFTAMMLNRWINVRPSTSDHIFTSMRTGQPLGDSGLNQLLKRLKKRANVNGRVNPHAFRHGFAREYIISGGDLSTLARLLGHSNVSITAAYYAVFSPDELAAFHEKHTPLNKVKGQLKLPGND